MNADIDLTNVILHTPRLTLRAFTWDDLDDFYAYARVDGVGQMAGWWPHQSIEESRDVLGRFIEGKKTFALVRSGRTVGSLGVERYHEDELPELAQQRARMLGFVLSKDYWGQGLMPEAVNAALEYLFDQVKLDAVLCAHYLSNARSARVQQKCGFVPYRAGRRATRFGTVEDDMTNILTRERWLALTGRPTQQSITTQKELRYDT